MFTLKELAALVHGTVLGDGDIVISGVSDIRNAKPGTLTFLDGTKYMEYSKSTEASAILTDKKSALNDSDGILVKDVRMSMAKILAQFNPQKKKTSVKDSSAIIDPSAKLGKNVSVGPFAVIEDDVVIGDNTSIGSHSIIGKGTIIGSDVDIHSGVKVYHTCKIGNQITIFSGTVIGADGFGFVTEKDIHIKIPQIGRVILEDNVEIGANCTMDRGTMGDTVIGEGSKLDDQVHIGHNVHIGKGCLFAAQSAIGGSTIIGNYCMFGGKSTATDHVVIGDRSLIAAVSAVMKSVPGGEIYSGRPARKLRDQQKKDAVLTQISGLKKRLRKLEENS